jgi:hypothetical protein
MAKSKVPQTQLFSMPSVPKVKYGRTNKKKAFQVTLILALGIHDLCEEQRCFEEASKEGRPCRLRH